ncbi:hypothetical protein COY96_02025, partial [Candidatus Wolfebacteria bacterium CG_4_10_14_0_8_um_filter_37_11]
RKDFYLYVDEFQNFVTDSFANILSEARKYRLNLIIAHQYVGQLATKDSTVVRDAIFGNVGTMIIFRVGATDADFLEKELSPEFTIEDVVNLPNRQIYLKLMVDGVTSRPFSANTLPPLAVTARDNNHEDVVEMSRKLYTKPKRDVEEEISRWSGLTTERPKIERKFGNKKSEGREIRGTKPAFRKEGFKKFTYASHLGEIGIEFEPPRRKTFIEKNEVAAKAEEIKMPLKKEISLKELKKPNFTKISTKQKEPTIINENQIKELKDAIKKAIEEA